MSSPSFAEPGGAGDRRPLRVALLGSTGSIGRQTVEVLAAHPEAFTVVALATGSNIGLLQEQAAQLAPLAVALADDAALAGLDLPAGTERVGYDRNGRRIRLPEVAVYQPGSDHA